MEELTGRHYIISALKRKQADRIPTTVLIGPYCSRMTRYSVREILTDAKKSAEAHVAFYERFQPDSVVVYNDIYLELEAIGCELVFPEDGIAHPKAPLLQELSDLARLKVPDPGSDGRLPYFFELIERVSSQIKKKAAVGLGHCGPWNLALHLRGVENMLIETATEPDFVHELMKYTTEVVRTMGDALIEAGYLPSLGEASASCSLISPQIYHDFVKPYHMELQNHFLSKKAPMSLHICGLIDPMMEDVLDTGVSFFSLDAPSSLQKMVDLAQGKITIMGNVPTDLFARGSREDMEKAIDRCLDIALEGGGFILSSGCEIPLNSTEDRIDYFFSYAHQASSRRIKALNAES